MQVEVISLRSEQFLKLVRKQPAVIELVQENTRQKALVEARMETTPQKSGVISFLMQEGLGEATNALLIDETLCGLRQLKQPAPKRIMEFPSQSQRRGFVCPQFTCLFHVGIASSLIA